MTPIIIRFSEAITEWAAWDRKIEKEIFMYHWVKDKEFLKSMRTVCSDAVNRLTNELNRNSDLEVSFHIVGSGGRNMIAQNENEPIDLDFNLVIESAPDINDCHAIKETVRKTFNYVLEELGWGDCSDSTSALTTKQRIFKEGNKTPWSIDLAIVCEANDGSWWRLIHKKTGRVSGDSWVWEQGKNSKELFRKEAEIKDAGYWNKVRETYLNKKNLHLTRNENNTHPSFICYIEAINEVYSNYLA